MLELNNINIYELISTYDETSDNKIFEIGTINGKGNIDIFSFL